MVVVTAKTFIFSLEKKRKRRKERKRKGREKREKKEGRDWYIQKTVNILLFWLVWSYDSQTLCSHMEICEDLRLSNVRIHCSKSLVKHVLAYIGKLGRGAAKAGGYVSKDTEHIVTYGFVL